TKQFTDRGHCVPTIGVPVYNVLEKTRAVLARRVWRREAHQQSLRSRPRILLIRQQNQQDATGDGRPQESQAGHCFSSFLTDRAPPIKTTALASGISGMSAAMSFVRGRSCLSRATAAASTMGAGLILRLINPTNNALQSLLRKLRVGRQSCVIHF